MEKKFQPTLFQGDSLANLSPLQEKEKEQKMIAISGHKCYELLPKSNQDGLLGKMCKALLTSTTAWYSDRSKLIWKHKVSKSNVLLFQLQASVLGTKETESGLSDVMYPTPTVGCEVGGEQSKRVERTKSGGFILRKKNKPQNTFGAKLSDAMLYLEKKKQYPTPTARDWKCGTKKIPPCTGKTRGDTLVNSLVREKKNLGGKLNPNFVEFLMGYNTDWTKIEQTESKVLETQSSLKSQEKLDLPSLKQKKMYRTPTAMDIGENSFVYAAKILKGKTLRKSKEVVQKTLSIDVAINYLKENPHLIDQYDKAFIVRPNLPKKEDFLNYIKSNTTIKKLSENTDIPKTKIEHWFRKDNCFSYPSIIDWNKIKPYLKEIKFNDEMTYEKNEDWIES